MTISLGIVLGGGGARGLAHVGVLRALAEADIHPDLVVGVSMGAVIGATYAAREDWLEALYAVDRTPLPGHENLTDVEGLDLVRALFRSAVKIAPKVVNFGKAGYAEFGREIMDELLGGHLAFDQLRLPFAAVATDIAQGRRAVLDSGDVADAVIASAALPVLTSPIVSGDSRFLDGGFADPAPIDVARDMGAEHVVVIHVGSPPTPTPSEAEGPLLGMVKGLEVGVSRFVETRLGQADVVVTPDFDPSMTWLSFDRAEELTVIGHKAMAEKIDDLRAALRR